MVTDQRADERHDAEEHVPCGSSDADELRHRVLTALVRVAHRPAEADDGVEGIVVETGQLRDVGDDPVDDAIFEPCIDEPT